VERVEQRRATVERWLGDHPSSPALQMGLARLARAQGDWPAAEAALHRAIAQGAGADAWEELGHGLAAQGDDALARQCYANALRAARGERVAWITAEQDTEAPLRRHG
jgi:HemY protein